MPFLIVLLALVALNAWMTRRILRAGDTLDHKGMHIAMVWIAPFIGAVMAIGHVRPHGQAQRGLPLPERSGLLDVPPVELTGPGGERFDLLAHLAEANGVPLLHWPAVNAWLDGIEDADARRIARLDSQRAWLLYLREALGPQFSLRESEDSLVLSSLETPVAEATARYIATTRKRVGRVLGELARLPSHEKSVLLVLDSEEDYYHYVALYYPEQGEFAFSGGMFIDAGCPHFVVRRADLSAIEPVIAHELTHAALSAWRLPLWLDEGIAVNTEHRLSPRGQGQYTPEELRRLHARFWTAETIQQFWTGESFKRTDDGNLLSYDLARIFVEQTSRDWAAFAAFVAKASRQDAGAAAAQSQLNMALGAAACVLVGHEPDVAWEPGVPEPARQDLAVEAGQGGLD